MFHSCSFNKKINRLHKRCLRMIYNVKQLNFKELLVENNSVSIYHRNNQHLAIQIYMIANGLPPDVMSEIFQLRENTHFYLRHTSQFTALPIDSVYNGSESVSNLRPKIGELIPPPSPEIKGIEFKETIKKWKPNDCPCRLCKNPLYFFINDLGFIKIKLYWSLR